LQAISVGGELLDREAVAVPDECVDLVAGLQELREKPEADVPICTSEEDSHRRDTFLGRLTAWWC